MSFLPPLDFSHASPRPSTTTTQSCSAPQLSITNAEEEDDNDSFETISTLSIASASGSPTLDNNTYFKASESAGVLVHADSALGQLPEYSDEDVDGHEVVEDIESVISSTLEPCVETALATPPRRQEAGRKRLVKKSSIIACSRTCFFRCDIQPPTTLLLENRKSTGSGFSAIEADLKATVIASGGTILDDCAYLGGFLYSIPSTQSNPLTTCFAHTITPWTHPFPQPQFNGLRLTPYGGAGEFLLMPIPAHLSGTSATPHRLGPSEKRAGEVIRRSWMGAAGDRGGRRLNAFVRELGRS